MPSRRPPDDGAEEDESTALDLGRNIASVTRKPVAPTPRRASAGPADPAPKAPAPRASPPLHASDRDDEDTDYIAVRPSSGKPGSGASPPGVGSAGKEPKRPDPRERDVEPAAPAGTGQSARMAQQQEDDTEFLVERPTGQSLSLKAMSQSQVGPEREMRGLAPSKRVVALGDERSTPRAPVPSSAEPPRAPPPRGAHRPVEADEENDVTEPPQRAPLFRGSSRSDDELEDITDPPVSMPRVTRFFVAAAVPKKAKAFDVTSQTDPGENDDDAPHAPPPESRAAPQTMHRPLPARADMSAAPLKPVTIVASSPNPFKRESSLTRSSGPTTASHTVEAESAPADGLLVVEVPAGAVVIVDGEERGSGPQVRVEGLHRYQRHTIKVHAPGHLRWTGSVSLEGRTAAKVRPALKKK